MDAANKYSLFRRNVESERENLDFKTNGEHKSWRQKFTRKHKSKIVAINILATLRYKTFRFYLKENWKFYEKLPEQDRQGQYVSRYQALKKLLLHRFTIFLQFRRIHDVQTCILLTFHIDCKSNFSWYKVYRKSAVTSIGTYVLLSVVAT